LLEREERKEKEKGKEEKEKEKEKENPSLRWINPRCMAVEWSSYVACLSVFSCPHCGFVADRDAQAAKNILGHGLSVLRELDPDLYKQCIHGTSLAGGADGCCIPARA
jgi:hypothetical protein